jgi:hypothetical protein
MREDIKTAYRNDPALLGIFPIAAYNGGPRNVTRLYNVLKKLGVSVNTLHRPGVLPANSKVKCPCVWKQEAAGARALALPRYNNENRWYVEKYQAILESFESVLEQHAAEEAAAAARADIS